MTYSKPRRHEFISFMNYQNSSSCASISRFSSCIFSLWIQKSPFSCSSFFITIFFLFFFLKKKLNTMFFFFGLCITIKNLKCYFFFSRLHFFSFKYRDCFFRSHNSMTFLLYFKLKITFSPFSVQSQELVSFFISQISFVSISNIFLFFLDSGS